MDSWKAWDWAYCKPMLYMDHISSLYRLVQWFKITVFKRQRQYSCLFSRLYADQHKVCDLQWSAPPLHVYPLCTCCQTFCLYFCILNCCTSLYKEDMSSIHGVGSLYLLSDLLPSFCILNCCTSLYKEDMSSIHGVGSLYLLSDLLPSFCILLVIKTGQLEGLGTRLLQAHNTYGSHFLFICTWFGLCWWDLYPLPL